MEFLIGWVVFGLISGAIGAWVAEQKNRTSAEGFTLGFFLGPIGWLLEALLPTLTKEQLAEILERKRAYREGRWSEAVPPSTPTPPPLPSLAPEEIQRIEEAKQERARRQNEARMAREAAYERRQAKFANFLEFTLGFGWFRALPDWLQPIVVGLVVAAPMAAIIALAFS